MSEQALSDGLTPALPGADLSGQFFMATQSGRRVDLFAPRPEQIDLLDIASGLARISRFGGQTIKRRYSVAEHSFWVAWLTYVRTEDPSFALAALHHDDTEAYLGDMIAPMKRLLSTLAPNLLEGVTVPIATAIETALRVPSYEREAAAIFGSRTEEERPEWFRAVEFADRMLWRAEARCFLPEEAGTIVPLDERLAMEDISGLMTAPRMRAGLALQQEIPPFGSVFIEDPSQAFFETHLLFESLARERDRAEDDPVIDGEVDGVIELEVDAPDLWEHNRLIFLAAWRQARRGMGYGDDDHGADQVYRGLAGERPE